jgi:dimethylhistidine N-methyltransferase
MKQVDVQMLPSLHEPAPAADFGRAVLSGLRQLRKTLPCKFLYDETGSRLFDRICELEEYYLSRCEMMILRRCARQIAGLVGEGALLVEYGSGAGVKTRILLDHLDGLAGYVPIDISRAHLLRASRALAAAYPQVRVMPLCADYTGPIDLPSPGRRVTRKVVWFPGSSIGNFEPQEARRFLARARELAGRGGGLLIGVDLKKDPRRLHAAYNDAQGITAAFNLNLLQRINRELQGNFILDRFAHYAFYNPRQGRMEMHLLSLGEQEVRVAGQRFFFADGETIFTESSYKYSIEEFTLIADDAGWRTRQVWTDSERLFSAHYLTAE